MAAMGKYWTHSYNPVVGCEKEGPSAELGCLNCYALRMACRLAQIKSIGEARREMYDQATRDVTGWTGKVFWDQEVMAKAWRELSRAIKPRVVFISDMADLFHRDVTDDQIFQVLALAAALPMHTFLLLTKRAERLPKIFNRSDLPGRLQDAHLLAGGHLLWSRRDEITWPPPNLFVGVTVENQDMANLRLVYLFASMVAKIFVSYEPALGHINWERIETPGGLFLLNALSGKVQFRKNQAAPWKMDKLSKRLDWITAGGETGPGAIRSANLDWFRSTRDQAAAAGVPFWLKHLGRNSGRILDGRYWSETPVWERRLL